MLDPKFYFYVYLCSKTKRSKKFLKVLLLSTCLPSGDVVVENTKQSPINKQTDIFRLSIPSMWTQLWYKLFTVCYNLKLLSMLPVYLEFWAFHDLFFYFYVFSIHSTVNKSCQSQDLVAISQRTVRQPKPLPSSSCMFL